MLIISAEIMRTIDEREKQKTKATTTTKKTRTERSMLHVKVFFTKLFAKLRKFISDMV